MFSRCWIGYYGIQLFVVWCIVLFLSRFIPRHLSLLIKIITWKCHLRFCVSMQERKGSNSVLNWKSSRDVIVLGGKKCKCATFVLLHGKADLLFFLSILLDSQFCISGLFVGQGATSWGGTRQGRSGHLSPVLKASCSLQRGLGQRPCISLSSAMSAVQRR